ncbi:MAG: hypothetical protein ACRD8Z_07205, partial [Nitrososphaeraceae archaeon]
ECRPKLNLYRFQWGLRSNEAALQISSGRSVIHVTRLGRFWFWFDLCPFYSFNFEPDETYFVQEECYREAV